MYGGDIMYNPVVWFVFLQVYGKILYYRIKFFGFYIIARKKMAAVEQLVREITQLFAEEIARSSRFEGKIRMEYSVAHSPGYRIYCDGTRQSPICWDAPIGIVLHLDNRPVCGMAVQFCGKTLSIRQLQGIKGVKLPGVLRETWTQVFVRGCCRYASRQSGSRVRVFRADRNLHYQYGGDRSEALSVFQERMRCRYDGTALALGFVPKRRYYEWQAPQREWY